MSWRKVKLGEVCRIEKGSVGIQKAIPGEYPMVVTGEERKSHNEFQFDDEAVIIPLVSGTGHGHASIKRIHFQKGKFALGSILCAVIPKNRNEVNAEYLYRYLDLNKENELVARMKGMANVTLPMKEIALIEIQLPPLEEQIQFVEKYKKLEIGSDLLSTELTNELSLINQLRQSFLREAMQGRLLPQKPSDGNAKDLLATIKSEKAKLGIKEKSLPLIKSEEIPFEIPENWVWCRLAEITTQIFDGPFGSHLKTQDYTSSGVQVIRLENLGVMKFNAEKETFISNEKFDTIKQHRVFKDDIIIGSFLSDGVKCVILPSLNNIAIAKADCFTIRIGHNRLLNKFLMYMLSSSLMFTELSKLLRGMTRLRINTTQLKNFPVPLPPHPEQHRIVAKLDQLMQTCDALEASIKQSKEQNEMLLQQVLREALNKN